MTRLALLLLLAALPAGAQEAARVPYEDVFHLSDGTVLRGRVVSEDSRRVSIRVEGRSIRDVARTAILRTRSREEVYLDEARAAAARDQRALALEYYQVLLADGEAGGPWRAAAEREVEDAYYEATREGLAVVVTREGRTFIGELVSRDEGVVVLTDRGGPFVARRNIDRILRFDDLLLARGDRRLREGKPAAALEEFRKLHARHEGRPGEWLSAATSRIGQTCLSMGRSALRDGRVEEAYDLLSEARRFLPADAGAKADLAAAGEARDRLRDEQKRSALALIEEARALHDQERYPEALRIVDQAAAVAPWLEEVREFRRQCQDRLLLLVSAEVDLPRDFRPLVGSTPAERRAARLLFEPLVDLDDRGEPVLALAESVLVAPDDRTYTFRLRPGLVWSDGKPLTAVDVQFSARAWTHPASERIDRALARTVERIEVPGPREIRFHLARRHPDGIGLFRFPVLPRHALGAESLDGANPFFLDPVVSGPYVLGEVREHEIHFYKNLRYRRPDRPRVYGIVFRRFADGASALQAMRRGEVDVWPEVSPSAAGALAQAGSEFRLLPLGRGKVEILLVNHRRDLLAHRNVRRALGRALPREAALLERAGGEGERPGRALVTGPFAPDSWRSDPGVAAYRYEPAYGRELLREHLEGLGWRLEVGTPLSWMRGEERLTLRIVLPAGDEGLARACRKLAGGIEELGFQPELVPLAADEFDRRVRVDHDFDLALWTLETEDLDELGSLFDPFSRGPGGTNVGGYLNPTLIEELHGLAKVLEPAERARRYHRIHDVLSEDVFALFLWRLERYAATSIRVIPAGVHPDGTFRLAEDWRLVPLD